MKKLIIVFMLISSVVYGQEKSFHVTENDFTDFIVTDVKGVKKEILYKKSMEWISKTFNTSDEVIKSKVLNDFIRFEAVSKVYCTIDEYSADKNTYCYPTKYTIELSFKDGRYKFDIVDLKIFISSGKWNDLIFFKEGYGGYKDFENIKKVPEYFNSLNENLNNYILGKKTTKDNW